jgi:hypothetical protein
MIDLEREKVWFGSRFRDFILSIIVHPVALCLWQNKTTHFTVGK